MLSAARQRPPSSRSSAALAVGVAALAAALLAVSSAVAFAQTFCGTPRAPRRGVAALRTAVVSGRSSGWRRASSARAAKAEAAGDSDKDEDLTPQQALELLEDIEEVDGFEAQELATDEELAQQIAIQASSGDVNKLEIDLLKEEDGAEEEKQKRQVVPSSAVYDFESLLNKYGSPNEIIAAHQEAADLGVFVGVEKLEKYLNGYVMKFIKGARKAYAEFKHASGSRLVLVGTNHLLRASADFVVETVQRERPECLVIERRLGDDSLQRLTVPEVLYQNLAMAESPGVFREGDTAFDLAKNFQEDMVWLQAFPAWDDTGGPASECLEFGAAFDEFVRQRQAGEAGGPRGGTLCFADTDVRQATAGSDLGMAPSLSELAEGGCMALRDLSMASSMRAALKTHKSVVGVVGQAHMAGIIKLLQQDKSISLVDLGEPAGKPDWNKDFKDGGVQWERELAGLSKLFLRLMETSFETAPLGTFFDWDALKKLQEYKEESERSLRSEGLSAKPAAPASSDLARDFFARGLAASPKDEAELKRWLSGQNLGQEAGPFPYENKRLRKKAPALPSSGFGEVRG